MQEQLANLINNFKARGMMAADEAATKQGVILRLLAALGWDPFDTGEVFPEYSVRGGQVDYALRIQNTNKVFIEVKKIGEELTQHQEQLLNYSYRQAVKLAILTNGMTWWFYLPLQEDSSWEQRKFYTIDIPAQRSEDIASKFIDLLSKQNVASGTAVQQAEDIYRGQQTQNIVRQALPQAWINLLSGPDELLTDLLKETVGKLCGYDADPLMVGEFLSQQAERFHAGAAGPGPRPAPGPVLPGRRAGLGAGVNYTGKSMRAFTFRGARHEVRSWKDLLIRLCEILAATHGAEFERVLRLKGTKRSYFSLNQNELASPQKVPNARVYAETNLSANYVVKNCRDVLALLGYSASDLAIEAT